MVVLCNTGQVLSMVLWSSWENYDDDYLHSWPRIEGNIKLEEIAFILEVSYSKNNLHGAKLLTQRNIIGWISANFLKKVVIPVGVDPTPP